MNTIRFLKCVLCVFTGFLISEEGSCLPGQTINVHSNSPENTFLSKEYGFDFSGQGLLYFQIKSCGYGKIVISDEPFYSSHVVFSYGNISNSLFIAIRYKCHGCYTAYKYKTIVSCYEYRHHWIHWADGIFALGEGLDASNQSTRVVQATKDPITVKEISLSAGVQGKSAFFKVVKDNAPSFKFPNPDGSSQVEMVEKRPVNSTVLTVRATDPESDPLTFSVEGNDSSTFHFDGENLKISSILNMDTNDLYRILIRMTDGKNVREVNVTLLVLPLLTKGDRVSITEELPLSSMVDSLYQIHDDRTDLNFSLHGTHSDFFSINETNGKISVAKRVDRERLSRHYLDDLKVVVATSDGETTASLWINITVTDINDNLPKCVPSALYVEVPENSTTEERLLNISCTDRDPGVNGLITLEILEPIVLKPLMNVSTTEISIQGNALDLETMTTDLYIVSIKVSDSPVNTDPLESMFYFQLKVLGVNEHKPTFTHPILNNDTFDDISVYENVSVGSIIWSFSASDADHGQDGQLTFFLHSVISDKGGNHISDMTINNDGELMTTRILDRDSPVNGVLYYKVTVGVRDNGNPSKTSLATLHIDLKDINDNIPTFKEESYDILITCEAAIGDQLEILEVSDPDNTSEITIVSIKNTDGFLNVSHDGNITLLKRPVNSETDVERVLRISASDEKWSVQGFLIYSFVSCPMKSTPSSLMTFISSDMQTTSSLATFTFSDMQTTSSLTTIAFSDMQTLSSLMTFTFGDKQTTSSLMTFTFGDMQKTSSLMTFTSSEMQMSDVQIPTSSISAYTSRDSQLTDFYRSCSYSGCQTPSQAYYSSEFKPIVVSSPLDSSSALDSPNQSPKPITFSTSPIVQETTESLTPLVVSDGTVHTTLRQTQISSEGPSYQTSVKASSVVPSSISSQEASPTSSTTIITEPSKAPSYQTSLMASSVVTKSNPSLLPSNKTEASQTSPTTKTSEPTKVLITETTTFLTTTSDAKIYHSSLMPSSVVTSSIPSLLPSNKNEASQTSSSTETTEATKAWTTEPTKVLATSSSSITGILEDVGLKGLCIIESTALIVIASVYIYKKWMLSKVLPSPK